MHRIDTRIRNCLLIILGWGVSLAVVTWNWWDWRGAVGLCCCISTLNLSQMLGGVGILVSAVGFSRCLRLRSWRFLAVMTVTFCLASWIAIDAPVERWGDQLVLWRNRSSFMEDVRGIVSARTDIDVNRSDLVPAPSGRLVMVDFSPLRIAFERRELGFGWRAIVYDPTASIEGDEIWDRMEVFRWWHPTGYYKLDDAWFVLSAVK